MSLLIVGLDATIVNVALPAIHRSLHASLSGLQWTVDAYPLVLAGLLVLAGSAADRVGRRRVFQVGLAVFGLGSLLCGPAPTTGWLIAGPLGVERQCPVDVGDRHGDHLYLVVHHMSRTTSVRGREQQMSTCPSAGSSSGSGS